MTSGPRRSLVTLFSLLLLPVTPVAAAEPVVAWWYTAVTDTGSWASFDEATIQLPEKVTDAYRLHLITPSGTGGTYSPPPKTSTESYTQNPWNVLR